MVNFLCSAVTLPAAIAVAFQNFGHFPFLGCMGGKTQPQKPAAQVAPAPGATDMSIVVVPNGRCLHSSTSQLNLSRFCH